MNIKYLIGSFLVMIIFTIGITGCKSQKKVADGYNSSTMTITSQDYMKKGDAQLDTKNYNEALISLNKAIELDTTNGEAYAYRGMTKYYLTDLKGAMSDYNVAIRLIPNYGEVYDLRGIIKGDLGDKAGACEDWNKSFELGYNKAYELIEKYCIDEENKNPK
jgi:tetratricopeptide (TPR) repeat protein